jgi:hypothetical protein
MQRLASVGLLVTAVAVQACGGSYSPAPTSPNPLVSADVFIRTLEEQGIRVLRVEEMGRQSHPYFSVTATRLLVSDENVWVFAYASAQAADRDAALIAPDGYRIGNSMVDWIGPPRFYKKDQLIVLYVGSNPQVIRQIESALGAPIAGR